MNQEVKDELNLRRKIEILKFIDTFGNVSKECKEFGIPRSSYYNWKKKSGQPAVKLSHSYFSTHTHNELQLQLNNFCAAKRF